MQPAFTRETGVDVVGVRYGDAAQPESSPVARTGLKRLHEAFLSRLNQLQSNRPSEYDRGPLQRLDCDVSGLSVE